MIGSRIGDYVVDQELWETATQVAYAATHVLLPRRARVTLAPANREAALPLMRTACVLEALHHPGVPRVYECGVLHGRPWIATELIDGWSVGDAIARAVSSAEQVAMLLRDAADILAHAHRRGVVHGGLTASTLVRRGRQPDAALCITGWDHARCGDDLPGDGDLQALGAIALAALGADDAARSAVEQCPGVPLVLSRLIDRLRAADPAQRPTAARLRTEAIHVLELIELPLVDERELDIEVVEVELIDISRRPPPPPGGRWTPPDGLARLPATAPGPRPPRGKLSPD